MTDPIDPLDARENVSRINLGLNFASFAIVAVSGLLYNIIVVAMWDPNTLGVINQVLGVFIVSTQLGVLGQQNAILNRAGLTRADPGAWSASFAAALLIAILSGGAMACVVWLAADGIAEILQSQPVGDGVHWIAVAIFCSCVSKIGMFALNGRDEMRAFAFVQAVRPIVIIGTTIYFGLNHAPASYLPLAFVASEATTLVIGVGLALKSVQVSHGLRTMPTEARRMLSFGVRSMSAGFLGELNSRIDYLILGAFTGDVMVGRYAFAATLAEGFYMLIGVLRTVLTPKVAALINADKMTELARLASFWRLRSYTAGIACAVIAILCYPLAIDILRLPEELKLAHWPFIALVSGVALAAGYIPLSNILLLAHRPGVHSIYMLSLIALNAVANLVLVPSFGALGSGIGTGIAYAASALLLVMIARGRYKLPI
jgi:O-antigen/teichoic acid export membrane protein